MDTEQIVGVYKIFELVKEIQSIAIWSCYFNFNGRRILPSFTFGLDVLRMQNSETIEDSHVLKEASDSFIVAYRKTDKYCNSPIRSKYLSQNYLDNYLLVEGVCKNMIVNANLTTLIFCGIRLSMESMNILSETFTKSRTLKEFTLNFCLLDISLLEALMPGLC
jgi:hypothetical protein